MLAYEAVPLSFLSVIGILLSHSSLGNRWCVVLDVFLLLVKKGEKLKQGRIALVVDHPAGTRCEARSTYSTGMYHVS